MNEITVLIVNVAILFIMMVPGIILKKCKFVPDGFGKGISNLVLYIAQPVLIVYSYLECDKKFSDIWLNILIIFILSMIVHIIFAAVAIPVFSKTEESHAKMLKFATIFSNAAFMGIPLIRACMNPEAAIYASVYNISFNLFLWTLGVHLCTRKRGQDLDGDGDSDLTDEIISMKHHTKKEGGLLKVLLHPVTLASVIGVVLMVCGINISMLESSNNEILDALAKVFIDSLAMLKNLVAPLAMTVIGLRLADINLKGFFNDIPMYIFLILRHLALPLVILGIIKLAILAGVPISDDIAKVTIILAAAPAASSATMFAEKYNCDAVYVSRLVVVSTILCIATIPVILILI